MKQNADRARFATIATATLPAIANGLPPDSRIAVYQLIEVINRHADTIANARELLAYAGIVIDLAIERRNTDRAVHN